jgi:tRNA dimethylallyltransferase
VTVDGVADAMRPPVVALIGATASGKTRVALDAASSMARTRPSAGVDTMATATAPMATPAPAPIELVSVDSMAVYRGMDIGTAKPTPAERAASRWHLIDLVDASEEFTVQQFQAAGHRALADIAARHRGALLVGGTGLYLRSLIDDLTFPGRYPEAAASLDATVEAAGPVGSDEQAAALATLHRRLAELDPPAAARIEPSNRRRLVRALEVTLGSGRPFSSFGPGLDRYPPTSVALVGIRHHPDQLDRRIAERFARLMDLGFLEEVRALAACPAGVSRTARQALGYRELLAHFEVGVPLEEAVDQAIRRTRTFARRQMAWFGRDPRIVWLDPETDPVGAVVALFGEVRRPHVSVGHWSTAR